MDDWIDIINFFDAVFGDYIFRVRSLYRLKLRNTSSNYLYLRSPSESFSAGVAKQKQKQEKVGAKQINWKW